MAIAIPAFIRAFISAETCFEVDALFRLLILALFSFHFWRKNTSANMPLNRPIAFFFALAIISTLTSINLHSRLAQLSRLVSYICIFYLASEIKVERTAFVVEAVVGAAVLLSAYGIIQYLFGFEHAIQYLESARSPISDYHTIKSYLLSKRVFSTFTSTDIFGGYLTMAFFLGGGLLIKDISSPRRRNAIILSLFIIFTALILTKSLGALLVLWASLAVFFVLFCKRYSGIHRKRVLRFAVVCLIVATATVSMVVINRRDSFLNQSTQHNSVTQRISYWKSTLKVAQNFPLLGVGMGNFRWIYPKYKEHRAIEVTYSHNTYLQLWAEMGIFGFLGFLWIVLRFLKLGFRKEGAANDRFSGNEALRMGVALGGLAFLLHNLIDYDYFVPQACFYWWFILGLISASTQEFKPPEKRKIHPLLTRLVVSIIIIIAAIFTVQEFLAQVHFKKGLSLTKDKKLAEAIVEFRQAKEVHPFNDLYHLALARTYEARLLRDGFNEEVFDKAVTEYKQAINLNRFFPFHYRDLGILYLHAGMGDEAHQALEQALELYPTSEVLKRLFSKVRR